MVAPLSQASNNSTGMSGYTSSCGAGASTSAYVGTQQLAVLPGCSSSGMGEIQRSTGTADLGGTATYTLGADVDIHSEIHYTYNLAPLPNSADKWGYMIGLKIIKDVTIKVGTSDWEKIDQASMLAMAQLEMTTAEYKLWSAGLGGLERAPEEGEDVIGGGKLMCCVKGGYRGQLFVAAMPYQSVTVKVNFSTALECAHNPNALSTQPAAVNPVNFALYTKQHILSPYERGLMQSTDIIQLLGTTQYFTKPLPATTIGGEIQPIDLSFFNEYCTHIAVWCNRNGGGGFALAGSDGRGGQGDSIALLDNCEFVYNGTSAQGKQPASLLEHSNMMGLAGGGMGSHWTSGTNILNNVNENPHVMLFQLANTPCVTSLSVSQSQFAPFAGGDGISNNRYDVIQFKAETLSARSDAIIHFVAFGAQSILYSAGGAVKN